MARAIQHTATSKTGVRRLLHLVKGHQRIGLAVAELVLVLEPGHLFQVLLVLDAIENRKQCATGLP